MAESGGDTATVAKTGSVGKVRAWGFVRTDPTAPPPIEPQPPAVWLINRLQTDEDGDPLMEGIFANYNDDIILEVDENTLVGRYSPARGPAETLIIGDGLRIEDGVLIGEGGGEKGDPGPPGPQGPVGPVGPAGASSSMWLYRFDSGTAASDPGAGRYRMNQTAPSTVTALYVDRLTQDGLDPTSVFTIAAFDDEFIIQERGLAARHQVWRLQGPAVMVGGDWFTVPVVFVSAAGAPFSNNDQVTFILRTKGEKGDPGPQGPQGIKGDTGSQGNAGPQGPVGGMGPVGGQGPQGLQGNQGVQGVAGPKGDKGDQGNPGPQGVPGPTGPAGDFGDNEAPEDGEIYGRSMGAWVQIESGGASVTMSDTPPAGAEPGDLWYETDSGFLFVWVDDGSSAQWVVTNPVVPVAGPQGEVGPIGPQGIQGIQGVQGIPGDMTQANADLRYLKLTGGSLSGGLAVQGGGFPTSGAGLEFVYSSGASQLQSYDRDASQWKPLAIRALDVSFSCSVTPNANGTLNLGSAALRWATVYTSDLSLSNGIGDWTIVEGEDDLFIYNNKRGKVYKFMLYEVAQTTAPPKKA